MEQNTPKRLWGTWAKLYKMVQKSYGGAGRNTTERPKTLMVHGRSWSTMVDHGSTCTCHHLLHICGHNSSSSLGQSLPLPLDQLGRPLVQITPRSTMVPWSVSERNKRLKLTSKRRTELKICVPEANSSKNQILTSKVV